MPASGSYTNTSALFRASVPQRSYAQLSAMKDNELRQGAILEERARQDQQLNQQRIATQQDTINQLKNLPLEAPDKNRVGLYLKGKQAELAKYIQDQYPGKAKDFFEAEGETWMKNTLSDLLSSDLYAVAQANKENVAMAKSAISKGDNLTGTFDASGQYIPAENALLDYMQGKSPTFQFQGSYKPDSQAIYDHFGKMDNPYGSKYDRNAFAPEADVYNAVTSKFGDKNGRDLFHRQFSGRSVPFKRYSLEDQQLFGLDVANKNSLINSRQQANARGWASIDIQRQRLANSQKDDDPNIESAMTSIVTSPLGTTPPQMVTKPLTQQLKTLNKPLSSIAVGAGKTAAAANFESLSGIPMQASTPALEFQELSGVTVAPLHNKYSNLAVKTGKLKEGILSDGTVLDLTKIPHSIRSVNSNLFIDQQEANRVSEASRTTGRQIYPDHEFRKATLFVKQADAAKNGITSETPDATPVKDKEGTVIGYTVDVMSPSKGFFQSKEIQNLVNKGAFGQKRANDIIDQNSVVDEFASPYDSQVE